MKTCASFSARYPPTDTGKHTSCRHRPGQQLACPKQTTIPSKQRPCPDTDSVFGAQNTFPLSGSLNALNLLSLEGLFAILRSLADSCGSDQAAKLDHHESKPNEEELSSEEAPNSVEQLRLAKQRKKRLAMGAEQFNRKPTKGLEFCQSLGLLPEVLEPVSIGAFLRTCPGLDKTAIGLYLGEPDDLNLKALTEFTNSFDFTDMELGDALRGYLATFRLPGESQKIARIIETFAARYFAVTAPPHPH